MSMHARIKRKKTTVFVYTNPTDTIAELKSKYAAIVDEPAVSVKLLAEDQSDLDESKTVADYNMENSAVVLAVYKEGDSWEAVDLQKFEAE
mmetsp:Transcript_140637/g.199333  ORF Transcript_140637/g.199333 Transcript_140637/m.199333 type:complete len:91 (+) Transcript_140637:30-302(+)